MKYINTILQLKMKNSFNILRFILIKFIQV